MLMRIAAAEEARQSREVRARLPGAAQAIVEAACGDVRRAGRLRRGSRACAAWSLCTRPSSKVADLADWLLAQGAERVSVSALEHVFNARNALYEALEAAIGA